MFESFGDVLMGAVAVVAIGYLGFAVNRKRKELADLFNVIDSDDAIMYAQLEDMVSSGVLVPHHRKSTAVATA
jgi:hypothetical protein